MPAITRAVPKYRKHKASGQATVCLSGRTYYLGPHGTKVSKDAYDRLVSEWLANGRVMAAAPQPITVTELCAAYWKFAKDYYRKPNGRPTSEIHAVKDVVRSLKRHYGDVLVTEFRPTSLRSQQMHYVDKGVARRTVNQRIQCIVRVFRWGVAREIVPADIYQALRTVESLKKGRTHAPDYPPVPPVADEIVEKTIPYLSHVVASMVRFQRLTGARPGEVCSMRPRDIDRSDAVWEFVPDSHKTEHHDRGKKIFIGARGQEILRSFLERDRKSYCFDPREAVSEMRKRRSERRVIPLSQGNRPGTNRKRNPRRMGGEQYTTDSYRRAIHRACDRAFPPPEGLSREQKEAWRKTQRWSPNQLRHSAATEIRARYGLEGSQVVLGHASAQVTEIYAKRDWDLARRIVAETG